MQPSPDRTASHDSREAGPDDLTLLRQIVDASADCIKVLDLGAHLLEMNAGGRRVMEIDDFSVCERALWPSLWPEETRPALDAAVAAAREGGTGRFEGFCPTFKGTPRWWEVTVSPVRGAGGRVERLVAISRDITRHRESEETARRQAELLELTSDAVIVWTPGRGVTSWNRAAEELYGFTRAEALGRVTHELLGTRREDGLDAPAFEARLREGGEWRGRLTHRAKDGREVIVDSRHIVLPGNQQGEFTVLEASRDVTEQVRAETRLRESEAQFRLLADANPIGVVIGDAVGGLPYVNDAYLRLIRASREDFEAGGVNWQAITPPEWLPADERAIAQALECGHSDPYEKEYRLPDGSRLPVLVALARAGTLPGGLVAYVLDLSDRKAAERALSDQNARLQSLNRQILDSAGEGIFGLDLRGHTSFANPAALALTGYALEELLGQSQHALLHHTRPDGTEYPEEDCPILASRRDGQVRRVDGEVFWRKDGTSFPVEYVATPLRGAGGETEGVVVTFRDVTARQEAEAALRRSNEDLARSNRDLEQFAFVAAHDLQEPLRTVVSYAGLLERKHGDDLHGNARRYLGFITDGATRMKTLVDDLLAYASLNVTAPARRPVPLDGPVGTALEALGAAVRDSGARVEVGELPTVTGDARQLTQVFQNLIGNALKFRRPGVPPLVRVTAGREGGHWHLRLEDNGIGIGPEYLERIFVMFQRLHTRDQYEGTGLGLAICLKIVEGHGGRLWAQSTPGEGTTFHLTLPAALET